MALTDAELAALPTGTTNAQALARNAGDFDTILNGSGSVENRRGANLLTLNAALALIGYEIPVAFTSGLSITRASQTVTNAGLTYHANPAYLPFTTTGTFGAQWMLISNVTAQDLASTSDAAKGAGMVGANPADLNYAVGTVGWLDQTRGCSIKWFSAANGDVEPGLGSADDTPAFVAARSFIEGTGKGWYLYLPHGEYTCDGAKFSYFTTIVGESHASTFVTTKTTASICFVFEYYPTAANSNNLGGSVRNITFIGSGTRQGTGISLGDPSTKPADAESINSMTFDHLRFENLEYGLRKPYGQIAQLISSCTFFNCDFGYYANFDSATHSGFDKLMFCRFLECKKFAFYADNTWLTEMDHCWFELNRGIPIFIDSSNGQPPYKNISIHHTWFEGNGEFHLSGPFSTVTVGATTYDTADLYVKAGRTVDLSNLHVMRVRLFGAILNINDCVINGTQFKIYKDSKSAVFIDNASLDQYNSLENIVSSVVEPDNYLACSWRTTHRLTNTYSYASNVLKKVVLNGASVNFGNSLGGTIATTPVSDGVIFDTSQELEIPAGANATWTGAGFTMAADRYYVMTLDVKMIDSPGTASASGVFLRYEGGSTIGLLGEFYSLPATTGRWHTIASLHSNVGSSPSTDTYNATIYNNTGAAFKIRLSALQVLEFSERQDAMNFLDSGVYAGK